MTIYSVLSRNHYLSEEMLKCTFDDEPRFLDGWLTNAVVSDAFKGSSVSAVDLPYRQVGDADAKGLLGACIHIETFAVPTDSGFCQWITSSLAL